MSQPPHIPKRPQKKARSEDPTFEGSPGLADSGNSDNSASIESVELKEPVIPRRPVKSKSSSVSSSPVITPQGMGNGSNDLDLAADRGGETTARIPVIPQRPPRTKTADENSSSFGEIESGNGNSESLNAFNTKGPEPENSGRSGSFSSSKDPKPQNSGRSGSFSSSKDPVPESSSRGDSFSSSKDPEPQNLDRSDSFSSYSKDPEPQNLDRSDRSDDTTVPASKNWRNTESYASSSNNLESQIPDKSEKSAESDSESVLNSQRLRSDENSDSDLEGDKTPGNFNTKITFKDDVEDERIPGENSGASSFNDDLETVSQEKDDSRTLPSAEGAQSLESPSQVTPPNPIIEEAEPEDTNEIEQQTKSKDSLPAVVPSVESFKSKGSVDSEKDFAFESQTEGENVQPMAQESDNYNDANKEDKTGMSAASDEYIKDSEEEAHVHPNPVSLSKNSESTVENKFNPTVPQRPSSRPLKSKSVSQEPSAQAIETKHQESDSERAASLPDIPARPRPQPKSRTTSDSDTTSHKTPVIPSRPKKEDVKSDEASSTPDSTKPKAPPPKPKKLSSKIAAFQQMFKQEQNPGESSDPSGPGAADQKPKPSPPATRGKLSSDKMKFAENLKGLMGKGVALPGMVNPKIRSPGTEDPAETEAKKPTEDDNETAASTSRAETKPIGTRPTRAKGPKGKRLPNSLKKPVNVEVKPRFSIVTDDLWQINFEKQEPSKKDEEKDTQLEDTADIDRESADELNTALKRDTTGNRSIGSAPINSEPIDDKSISNIVSQSESKSGDVSPAIEEDDVQPPSTALTNDGGKSEDFASLENKPESKPERDSITESIRSSSPLKDYTDFAASSDSDSYEGLSDSKKEQSSTIGVSDDQQGVSKRQRKSESVSDVSESLYPAGEGHPKEEDAVDLSKDTEADLDKDAAVDKLSV